MSSVTGDELEHNANAIHSHTLDHWIEVIKTNSLLSDVDLQRIAKLFPLTELPLLGIYRVNKIPRDVFDSEGFVILNLDREGGGTHWTVMILSDGDVYYNDSYGMPLPDDLLEILKKNGVDDVYWSTIQRQPIESNRCGWHCIIFAVKMIAGAMKYKMDLYDIYERLDKEWLQIGRGNSENRAQLIEDTMVKHIVQYFKLLKAYIEYDAM